MSDLNDFARRYIAVWNEPTPRFAGRRSSSCSRRTPLIIEGQQARANGQIDSALDE
ncbi:MAG: hypothetical protein JWQ95_256 [Sphaerisporangium sp.]|nr:hypothetical protein [Sphaerisporangium sp.]